MKRLLIAFLLFALPVQAGTLDDLKTEGVVVGYWDFRSGDLTDRSGNGNDGTATSLQWQNRYIGFNESTSKITISDDNTLQTTALSVTYCGSFMSQTAETLVHKQDAGGTNYSVALTATNVNLYDGTNTRTIVADITGHRCITVQATHGSTGELFIDGVLEGALDGNSSLSTDDAPLILGNDHDDGDNASNSTECIVITNRELTDAEASGLYSQLASLRWAHKPRASLYYDAMSDLTANMTIACNSGATVVIDWGDGNTDTVTCDGTNQAESNTYASGGGYIVQFTHPNAESGDVEEITYLNLSGEDYRHDLRQMREMTGLTYLSLANTSVSGDISNLSGMTGMTTLHLGYTSVSGDISNLSAMTGMTTLYLYNTSVTGNIAAVRPLENLTTLDLGNNVGANLTYTSAGALPAWPGLNCDIDTIGLNATEVDAWLNDFDDDLTGAAGDLNMLGNANRTAASNAACTAIAGDGWGLHVPPDYP